MELVRFNECAHSVFVSYAHADDEITGNWISDFARELNRDLNAELARIVAPHGRKIPDVHLSGLNGPVSGELEAVLSARVRQSFALIVVVHRHYLESAWCLRELQHFAQAFGPAGLDSRLQIVALSRKPMVELEQRPEWKSLFAGRSQVWQPFFANDIGESLIRVLRDDGRAPTRDFAERFDRMRDALVARIRDDLSSPPPRRPVARVLFGVCTPELRDEVSRLADEVKRVEPSVALLDESVLLNGLQELGGADALILPFNMAQPLAPDFAGGGHLALQEKAWTKREKPSGSLFALNLTDIAAVVPAEPEHRAYIEVLERASLSRDELRSLLCPSAAAQARSKLVRLYIESNAIEPHEWQPLGEQIRHRWEAILQKRRLDAGLSLRAQGLAIDDMDQYPTLDNADGIVLLWGQKEAKSLLSQIDMVEERLSDAAPGIVAYLSPPKPPSEKPVPAYGWKVLRFRKEKDSGSVLPDPADDDDLTKFLNGVLVRSGKRYGIDLRA